MDDHFPKLSQQAVFDNLNAVAARGACGPTEQQALFQAAADVLARATRAAQPILDLPPTATKSEVSRGRRVRAVRHGKDVYLPYWHELCTAMPNLLLRSALWPMTSIRQPPVGCDSDLVDVAVRELDDGFIPTLGDSTLINRGPALGGYDRGVFAACLDYYREDRPLTETDGASWVEVSFFKFLAGQGVNYHVDSHRALRASLGRLSAMSLHIRHQGVEYQLPRILEVSFADGEARRDAPRSSDLIYFRILAPFANLYGPSKWTAVPHDALRAGNGLKSWLATFYATHSKPFPTKLADLQQLVGSNGELWRFKAQLKDALKALMAPSQPLSARVTSFKMDDKTVTVHMAAWAKTAPQPRSSSSAKA